MMLATTGCSSEAQSAEGDSTVTIATDDGQEKHWQLIKEKLKDEGIDLKVKNFTDGPQINSATQNGDVDINLFQHIAYLSQFNVNSGGTLVPVGATAVYPLAIFSKEYDSIEDIPDGAEVAIPNNATNQARALRNLQTAGLLKLKDGGHSLSTPADVVSSKVKITPVDTNQTVSALNGSAELAVINNTQAHRGGLKDDDIIFKDDPTSEENQSYINAFVVPEDTKDDPRWQTIIDAYHTPEVHEAVSEINDGNVDFQPDWTPEQLEEILQSEEDTVKKDEGE